MFIDSGDINCIQTDRKYRKTKHIPKSAKSSLSVWFIFQQFLVKFCLFKRIINEINNYTWLTFSNITWKHICSIYSRWYIIQFKPTDISVTQYSEDLTSFKESLSNSMFFGGSNNNNNNNHHNNKNNNNNNNNNNKNNNSVMILTDQDNLYDEDTRSIELESNLI
ncbi:hypothetical protein ACTA71_011652 [Dictyostelium dimigraforme]